MSGIEDLKAFKVKLDDGTYCIKYTFKNGCEKRFFDDKDILLFTVFNLDSEDGGSVKHIETYFYDEKEKKSVITARISYYIDKNQKKSKVQAQFDENGFCTFIYNSTTENQCNVEYKYDLRGYDDTEGQFFKYAPVEKIINKGLPIEERLIYQYTDDSVTETTKNAAGDVISVVTHKLV